MLMQVHETDVAPELEWCEPPECVLLYDSAENPQQTVEVQMPGTNESEQAYGSGQHSQEKPVREAYGHLHPDIHFGPGEHATYTLLSRCMHKPQTFPSRKVPIQTLNSMRIAFAEACRSSLVITSTYGLRLGIMRGPGKRRSFLRVMLPDQEVQHPRTGRRSCPAPSSARCLGSRPACPLRCRLSQRSHSQSRSLCCPLRQLSSGLFRHQAQASL